MNAPIFPRDRRRPRPTPRNRRREAGRDYFRGIEVHPYGDSDLTQGLAWHDLDAPGRRRRFARAIFSSVLRAGLLIFAYYMAPFENGGDNVWLRLLISVAVVVAAVVISVLGILSADFPIIRAAEGISTLIVVTLIAFASTFVLMSRGEPSAFSEPLNHTGALYFSITTATTIGYGDISARSDAARIVVMIQMVVNVALLGVGLRMIINTAKRRARVT